MGIQWDRFVRTRLGIGEGRLRLPISLVEATEAAVLTTNRAGVSLAGLLARHQSGDWGEVSDAEWAANEKAMAEGGTVASLYTIMEGVRLWIFTQDNGQTIIALGEDL